MCSSDLKLSYAHADNSLAGNGLQEQGMLARGWSSVYTRPDLTENRSQLLNLGVSHAANEALTFSGNAWLPADTAHLLAGQYPCKTPPAGGPWVPVNMRATTGVSTCLVATLLLPGSTAVLRGDVFKMPPGLKSLEFVEVGDPGNKPDQNGLGSVAYRYRISKHETTAAQWVEFLNAKGRSDPSESGLWSENMSREDGADKDPRCDIRRSGITLHVACQRCQRRISHGSVSYGHQGVGKPTGSIQWAVGNPTPRIGNGVGSPRDDMDAAPPRSADRGSDRAGPQSPAVGARFQGGRVGGRPAGATRRRAHGRSGSRTVACGTWWARGTGRRGASGAGTDHGVEIGRAHV